MQFFRLSLLLFALINLTTLSTDVKYLLNKKEIKRIYINNLAKYFIIITVYLLFSFGIDYFMYMSLLYKSILIKSLNINNSQSQLAYAIFALVIICSFIKSFVSLWNNIYYSKTKENNILKLLDLDTKIVVQNAKATNESKDKYEHALLMLLADIFQTGLFVFLAIAI